MKRSKIICILILAVSLSGCQGDKQVDEAMKQKEPARPRQNPRSFSSNWEADTDISGLPGIISSISKELGIYLELQDIKVGQYTYTGVSPSGIDVKIEAIALVKDRSVLIVTVTGKREETAIMKPLLQIISNAIRTAVKNEN